MNKEQINQQAKEILDKFAKALVKVEKEKNEDFYIERDEFERIEGESKFHSKGFREKMLDNVSEHDDNFVIAEKGSWK